MHRLSLIFVSGLVLTLAACSETSRELAAGSDGLSDQLDLEANVPSAEPFPEVFAVEVTSVDKSFWRFDVTISSKYDTAERYADAWRVLDGEGNELGVRVLTHHHANEQPFTRSKTIKLPDDVGSVFVEGRDKINGWSGQRFKVDVVPL